MRVITIITLACIISACGQDGRLYLSDKDRLLQLENQGAGQSSLIKVKQRAEKERTLRLQVAQLKKQETVLRAQGKKAEADRVHLLRLEAQYEIGQIILARQEEGQQ